jgi:hypothetical protein
MTARLGSRFPSLSRKWKSFRDQGTSLVAESFPEGCLSRSRANSSRAPSIESPVDAVDRRDFFIPPTPTQSFHEDLAEDAPSSPTSTSASTSASADDEDPSRALTRTPLLPPVMTVRAQEEPVQSPLQSPKIADSPTASHRALDSPQVIGLPSPPLSSRPSITSFQPRPVMPPAEVPPMQLTDPQDEWSNKLGHANFTILPEPYLPETFDLASCRRLRTDWEMARCNYAKHLARTAEHYNTTSKVHQLTEEKWAQIEARWKRNYELARSRATDGAGESIALARQPSLVEPSPLTKIPSISGPCSDGKFPKLGDSGIVGPMTQIEPIPQPRPRRKRAFWKFLQGVLPSSVAFGRVHA